MQWGSCLSQLPCGLPEGPREARILRVLGPSWTTSSGAWPSCVSASAVRKHTQRRARACDGGLETLHRPRPAIERSMPGFVLEPFDTDFRRARVLREPIRPGQPERPR